MFCPVTLPKHNPFCWLYFKFGRWLLTITAMPTLHDSSTGFVWKYTMDQYGIPRYPHQLITIFRVKSQVVGSISHHLPISPSCLTSPRALLLHLLFMVWTLDALVWQGCKTLHQQRLVPLGMTALRAVPNLGQLCRARGKSLKEWETIPSSADLRYKSGWWFEPLWKILVNWDDYSQYVGK